MKSLFWDIQIKKVVHIKRGVIINFSEHLALFSKLKWLKKKPTLHV